MVIESLDSIVNAVPSCSASIVRQLLVDTPRKNIPESSEREPVVLDIVTSRLFGYFVGVGVQAVTIGYVAGCNTNSVVTGVTYAVSSAAIPVAVRAIRFVSCI
jgi:hypothetical protein